MLVRPEVIVDHDDLSRTVYVFWFNEGVVYLDKELVQTRETKRHKFVTDTQRSYGRIDQRSYGIKEEPELDIDIQLEALRQVKSQIVFKEWKR